MNNKYYQCKYYSYKEHECNTIKYGYCPVLKYNLNWITINDSNIICSYGIIDISWTQYLTKKDVIDKEFKTTIYTKILLFVYKIKDYFKSKKRFRVNIDF